MPAQSRSFSTSRPECASAATRHPSTSPSKPARTFEKRAANRLDAGFRASPAISGKAIYLRTKTHLYRIEK